MIEANPNAATPNATDGETRALADSETAAGSPTRASQAARRTGGAAVHAEAESVSGAAEAGAGDVSDAAEAGAESVSAAAGAESVSAEAGAEGVSAAAESVNAAVAGIVNDNARKRSELTLEQEGRPQKGQRKPKQSQKRLRRRKRRSSCP